MLWEKAGESSTLKQAYYLLSFESKENIIVLGVERKQSPFTAEIYSRISSLLFILYQYNEKDMVSSN